MSRIKVGKVSPIPKGNWGGANTAYDKLNMVNYKGVLYIAKQDIAANSNIAIDNTNYWMQATNSWDDINITLDSSATTGTGTITEGTNGVNTLNLTMPGVAYGTEIISDTSGVGDIDKVWSANKNIKESYNKADVITRTASGAMVHIIDGADGAPVTGLTVGIEPVQAGSGNPSPDNVRPISGWTGAKIVRANSNLIDIASHLTDGQGITKEYLPDGSFHFYGTQTIGYTNVTTKKILFDNPLPPGTYTFQISDTIPLRCYIKTYFVGGNDSNEYQNFNIEPGYKSYTVTTTRYLRAWEIVCSQGYIDQELDFTIFIQFFRGADLENYQNYNSSSTPISWQSEAGTVYGGSLNGKTRILTVTHANIASYNGETLPGKWISDRDVYASGTTPTNGAQVVYELATPLTYQLTPAEVTTLLGVNNIWADTGDVDVTYRADTKLYIDQQLSTRDTAIKSLMTNVEPSMTLTANRESGSVVIVGDDFYKLTESISSGSTLDPGINCTKVTMAEWILSII